MRFPVRPPAPVPAPQGAFRFPTSAEAVVVVVIVIVGAGLAAAGLPVFGVLEFLGALAYLACRTVKGLRDPQPAVEGI